MSFLIRRNLPLARVGWRDLDALHARPDENPIQLPWRRTNSSRTVLLDSNVLVIADYSETVLQVGGVSYEMMPLTPNWGCEFDLRIDGNVIQLQYFAMAISSSWAKVGFSDLVGVPLVAIWRDVASAVNNIRVIVYNSLAEIATLSQSANYVGLQNNSWYRVKLWIDDDKYVRVYINDVMRFHYWLPAQYAAAPNKRALNFLNQTTAPAFIKEFELYDRATDFPDISSWPAEVVYDTFNRANGAVANGWSQYGSAAGIVSNTYASTGSGTAAIIRDTGATHGTQRVEAVVVSPSGSADCSLVVRSTSNGSESLVANFYSGGIYIAKLSGGLDTGTMADYQYTAATVPDGALLAFSTSGEYAWVEINGVTVLKTFLNGTHAGDASHAWAGIRVRQGSGSWNDARVLTT